MNQRKRRGANAVEFALTLPVIIFILSGVVDYGYFLHLQYNMINAVTQGARAGVTTDRPEVSGDPVPKTVAETVAKDVWTAANLPGFPTVTATESGTAPNIQLQVVGTVEFVELVGVLPTPANITHTAVMRMDDQT